MYVSWKNNINIRESRSTEKLQIRTSRSALGIYKVTDFLDILQYIPYSADITRNHITSFQEG